MLDTSSCTSIYTIEKSYNYTYWITNIKEHKHYIGVRSCDIPPIYDLGIKYFSSSHNKEFMTNQKNTPKDYEYKIIGIFETRKEALLHEIELHHEYNVGKNPRFYNNSKQTATGYDRNGVTDYIHSEHMKGKNNHRYGNGRIIEQYDLYKNFIQEGNSLYFDNLGFSTNSSIYACCNGRRKTYNNYIWKYKDDTSFIFPNVKFPIIYQQYDLNGNFIKEGVIDTFIKEGFHKTNIHSCCRHKTHVNTVQGFKWKFKLV